MLMEYLIGSFDFDVLVFLFFPFYLKTTINIIACYSRGGDCESIELFLINLFTVFKFGIVRKHISITGSSESKACTYKLYIYLRITYKYTNVFTLPCFRQCRTKGIFIKGCCCRRRRQ